MLWLAEQKIIVEVNANTEEEAREIIKENKLQSGNAFAKVIKTWQQSWIVPSDYYYKRRLGIKD